MVICLNAVTAKSGPSWDKRVLAINGSPHRDGPTSRLLAAFLEALPPGGEVRTWRCYDRLPIPCDDCGYCRRRQGCSKRDLDEFYALLEAADVVVVATPVYHRSFSGPLKLLLDRTQRYWSARFVMGVRPPIARPKRAVLLTVSGSGTPEGGELTQQQLMPPLTVWNAELVTAVHAFGSDGDVDWRPFLDQARLAAYNVAEDTQPQR